MDKTGCFHGGEAFTVVDRHRGDQKDRGDIGDKHRQHMLESERDRFGYGNAAVQLVNIIDRDIGGRVGHGSNLLKDNLD